MNGLRSILGARRSVLRARGHGKLDSSRSAALWALGGAALLGFAPGCSETGNTPNASPQSSSCPPNTRALCPCTGGGEGSQICAASGDAYGPCEGCPPAAPEEDASLRTDASLTVNAQPDSGKPQAKAKLDAGTGPDGGVASSVAPAVAPSQAALDAAAAPDAAAERDAARDSLDAASQADSAAVPDASIKQLPPTLGTHCGVGLPATCALETEKCCVRSLATDTCMDVDAPCTCDTPDCDTLEMHCDGPEDCSSGDVCCGTLQTADAGEFSMCVANRYLDFTCRASCEDSATQRVACHKQESACPQDTVCANSQLLSNLQVCVDPATIEQ